MAGVVGAVAAPAVFTRTGDTTGESGGNCSAPGRVRNGSGLGPRLQCAAGPMSHAAHFCGYPAARWAAQRPSKCRLLLLGRSSPPALQPPRGCQSADNAESVGGQPRLGGARAWACCGACTPAGRAAGSCFRIRCLQGGASALAWTVVCAWMAAQRIRQVCSWERQQWARASAGREAFPAHSHRSIRSTQPSQWSPLSSSRT